MPTPFDPSLLEVRSFRGRCAQWLVDHPGFLFAFFRAVWPNLRVCRYVLVTRRDDVEDVMSQTGAFATRVGPRLAALHPDYPNTPVFGLGSDDDGTYAEALQAASAVLELGDVPGVARIARGFVEPRLAGRTTIDAAELIRLTQADAARRYFGLDVDDAALPQFALCGLALGNYMFGVQATGSDTWRASRAAGAEISAIMRRSIAHAPAAGPNTLIGRLVASGVAAGDIEAMLTGFVAGWVGGATVAAIHALQVLLGRSRAMRAAREAAADCDDAALGRCLFEAIRFSPIFPGAFRDCIADYTIAAGTRRRCAVRSGDVVMPATHSAMFDGTRVAAPRRFDPDRPAGDSMVLGYGRHFCIGHAFGRALVVETLKPLLHRRVWQRRIDRLPPAYFGTVPLTLMVQLR
ncbi:MAG TPA: hypothetical protein VJY39_03080 [Acidisphaera sp.]|nr:hypothetical protein [Acidisphaera sp.]